jgi:hypothetical protein
MPWKLELLYYRVSGAPFEMEAKKHFTNNQYCVYIVGIRDKLFARRRNCPGKAGEKAKKGFENEKRD